ncbi:hypothetical protein PInf_017076 [Phytophthora infestans]|nr:hypothetical protein PInf_017076 [Phytophthora infestans]
MATLDLPTKSRDGYKQLAHIGRGTYGDVFLCEHVESEDHVCVKEMDLTFLLSAERMRFLKGTSKFSLSFLNTQMVEIWNSIFGFLRLKKKTFVESSFNLYKASVICIEIE